MVSLATAKFDSDTDENDEDYDAGEDEANESDDGEGETKRKKKSKVLTEADEMERLQQVENAWAELCAESKAEAEQRPPRRPQIAIPGKFQRRHPRPPKALSKSAVWAELKKYNNVIADGAPPTTRPAEVKRRVRASGDALSGSGAGPSAKATAKPLKGMVTLEETLQFAGEKIVVRRKVVSGSTEDKKHLEKRALEKKRELGGQLSMLDSYLGALKNKAKTVTAMDKSQKDWRSFTDLEGLEADLAKDKRGGALERQAFLKRADARQQEELRSAQKAKRRRKTESAV